MLHARIQYGFGLLPIAISALPRLTFFLGGDGLSGFALDGREIIALRGYQNNSLTPDRRRYRSPAGGTIFDKYTLEMRYPLSLNPSATIFALAFAEGGNSWLRFRGFNPFEARRSLGAGIRIFPAGLRPVWSRLGLRIRQTPDAPDANGPHSTSPRTTVLITFLHLQPFKTERANPWSQYK